MPDPEIALALPENASVTTIAIARRAEERGFDRLVALGGGAPDALGSGAHDALVTAAVAAGATERIRLTAIGLALPGRGAAALGREAHTLDELSGGRLALGVRPRVGDLATSDARGFDDELDELRTGPAAALPLLVGGDDRAAIERAARAGDGWVAPVGATSLDVAIARAALRDGWRWNGRGGAPQVVVLLEAGTPGTLPARVATLAAAGATTVVLVLGHDDVGPVDVLADALGLARRGAVA